MNINSKAINILKKVEKRKDLIEWYISILEDENNCPVIFKDEFNFNEETNQPSLEDTAGIFKFEEDYPDRILFPTDNQGGWWFDENQEWYPQNIILVKTEKDLQKWEKLIVTAFEELED